MKTIGFYLAAAALFAGIMLLPDVPFRWKALVFMGALFAHDLWLVEFRRSASGWGTRLELVSLILNGLGLILLAGLGLLDLTFNTLANAAGNGWVLPFLLLYAVASFVDFLGNLRRRRLNDDFPKPD